MKPLREERPRVPAVRPEREEVREWMFERT